MSGKMIRVSLLSLVALAPFTVMVDRCDAGPILDWLLGRRRVARYGGMNVCCPQTQVARRVVVNYAPQTSYRNRWMRVPVTVYRPTATVDPVTGCQVTCMRPCTTYKWQVQKVAVTVMRPVYSTVLSNPCSVPATNCCTPTAAKTTADDQYYNRNEDRANTRPSLPMRENANGGNGGARTSGASTRSLLRRNRFPFPRRQLKPIPDPTPNRTLNMTPRLLRVKDRTAVYYPVRKAWAYTPIKWSQVTGAKRLIKPAKFGKATRKVRKLDDKGWRSE